MGGERQAPASKLEMHIYHPKPPHPYFLSCYMWNILLPVLAQDVNLQ